MSSNEDAQTPGPSTPRYTSARREPRKQYRVRKSAAQPITLHLTPKGGKECEAECTDLSIGGAGARFTNDRDPRLERGDAVKVRVQHLARQRGIELEAEIASVTREDGSAVRYGLRFTDVPRLLEQIDGFYSRFFNRRRHVRVLPDLTSKLPAKLKWSDGEIEARIHDISMAGIGLTLTLEQGAKLEKVTRLEMTLSLPGTREPILCRARVAAVKAFSKSMLVGIEFEEGGGIERYAAVLKRYIEQRILSIQQFNNAVQQNRKVS